MPRWLRLPVDSRRVVLQTGIAFMLALAVGLGFSWYLRGSDVWHSGFEWERRVVVGLNHALPSALDRWMLVVPWLGTNIVLLPLVVVMVWWLWRSRARPDLAVQLFVVQIGSSLLNPMLKFLTERPRPELTPPRGWYAWQSYPSGHAIASISVLGAIAVTIDEVYGWKWHYWVLMLLVAVSLYSRPYLGVHWPTDVIGGALVGGVWLAGTLYGFRTPATPMTSRVPAGIAVSTRGTSNAGQTEAEDASTHLKDLDT